MSRYQRLRAKSAYRRTPGHVALADDADRGGAVARAAQLAKQAPHLMREEDVASLQSAAGNRAVQRALDKRRPVVQRELSWQDTDWSKARYLDASSAGGGGVLFAGERSREVVVKPGDELAGEGAVASFLINHAAAAGGTGLGLAPGYRIPGSREKTQIKRAFTPLVGKPGQNARAAELVAKVDQAGLVIQDIAQGKQLKDVMQDVTKHTKKKLFGGGKRKLRKESPMRIFTDARALHALGSVTAVDLLMGNRDRLFNFNPENMFVSPYSLSMIDNAFMGSTASFMRKQTSTSKSGVTTVTTVDDALKDWRADPQVVQLAAGSYAAIAQVVFDRLSNMAGQRLNRTVDQRGFEQVMEANHDRFVANFADGLQSGKAQMLISLKRMLGNYNAMHKMVGGVGIAEIRRSLEKRRAFLSGEG